MTYNNKFVATVKSDGKVLREDNGTVYLPFNSDYSILLKNLNSQRASVNITIDDEDILNGSSLIVNANSDMELERWLTDDDKSGPKLRFAEKTEEIREARGENNGMDGIVRISWRYEKPITWLPNTIIWRDDSPLRKPCNPYPTYPDWENPYEIKYSTSVNHVVDGVSNEVTGGVYNTQEVSYRGTIENSALKNEDGMTIKGEESNQKFSTTHINDLEDEEHVICLKLKGNVNQKPVKKIVTVKTPQICSKCHQKNAWNDNFCSRCGNNLKY